MNREVKQLPISADEATAPPVALGRRIWLALAPNSRMKRWTYAGIILANLGDFWGALPIIAVPMLVISALYYTWMAARWLRAQLLWKVRNRILASFVFVGIVPICLALLISVTIGWFLVGAMGTNLTNRQFEATLDQMATSPRMWSSPCTVQTQIRAAFR